MVQNLVFPNVFHIFALPKKKKMAPSTSGLGRKIFNLVGVYKASQGFESPMRYKTNTKKKKSAWTSGLCRKFLKLV